MSDKHAQRLTQIKRFHEEYIANWDKPFPLNQYANWQKYDVNDVQFLLAEIEVLNRRIKLIKDNT